MVSQAFGSGSTGTLACAVFANSRTSRLTVSFQTRTGNSDVRHGSRTVSKLAAAFLPVVNFVKIPRDEAVAIGHFDFGKRRGVDHVVFLDDVIAKQNEGRERVDFIYLERTFLVARH